MFPSLSHSAWDVYLSIQLTSLLVNSFVHQGIARIFSLTCGCVKEGREKMLSGLLFSRILKYR